MKTKVYSWRVSSSLKNDLERAARIRKVRVARVLDAAVREWLDKNAAEIAGDDEQKRLHAIVAQCIGVVSGRDPRRAETASETIRKNLGRRYGR